MNNDFKIKYIIGSIVFILTFISIFVLSKTYAYAYSVPQDLSMCRYEGWSDDMKQDFQNYPYYLFLKTSGYKDYVLYLFDRRVNIYTCSYNSSTGSQNWIQVIDNNPIIYKKYYKALGEDWEENSENTTDYVNGYYYVSLWNTVMIGQELDSLIHGSNCNWVLLDDETKVPYLDFYLTNQRIVDGNTTFTYRSFPWTLNDDDTFISEYTYQFSENIENVEGMIIKRHARFYIGDIPFAQQKTVFDIEWQKPVVQGLKMEITVGSKYKDMERRYNQQTYQKPWMLNYMVKPEDCSMQLNTQTEGMHLLRNVWQDVDTGNAISIPPTELYFRYVFLDEINGIALYGNWTRLDLRLGPGNNAIVETRIDAVRYTEEVDPDTGEKTYQDNPVEGVPVRYVSLADGEDVSQEESFDAAIYTADAMFDDASNIMNGIGDWLGNVPRLVGDLFVFLPEWIIGLLGISITLVIILRIAGR